MKRKPFLLYHWAPKSRRKAIQRAGLKPKQLSRDGAWKPPYVCYSDSPSLAWAYSGSLSPVEEEWDLWMVWSTAFVKVTKRKDMRDMHPTEWRTTETALPAKIWRVGSRNHKPKNA